MVYIVGDTHGTLDIKKIVNIKKIYDNSNYSYNEIFVIVLGDFGLIWDNYPSKKESNLKSFYNSMPFTTLFIDGNHENFDRLFSKEFKEISMFSNKVKKISNKIFYLQRGHIYNIQNNTFFCMGGGESIDKNYRIPYVSWWKQELPSKKEMDYGLHSLSCYNNKIDYVLTHTCSDLMYKKIKKEGFLLKNDSELETGLRKYFDYIEKNIKFKKWFFGHFHFDIQLDTKHSCLYNELTETINV
jgi:hypothetical protein